MAWTRPLPSGRHQGVYRDEAGNERSAGTFATRMRAREEASRREAESRDQSFRPHAEARRAEGSGYGVH